MDREEQRRALEAYVRERLQREEHAHGRGYRADMARRSGLSKPHVTHVMMGGVLGYDAAMAFAMAWGMSPVELLTEAAVKTAKPLPNLETAITVATARDALPDEVVAKARRIGQGARDFSVQAWLILLEELAADLADATSDGAGRRAGR